MVSNFVGAHDWGVASLLFLYVLGWGRAFAEHTFLVPKILYVRDDKCRGFSTCPKLWNWVFFFFFPHDGLWARLLAKPARPFLLTALVIAFRRNTYS